jgi:hypothetical protein
MKTFTLCLVALLLAPTSAAMANHSVGPELPLGEAAIAPGPFAQKEPSVAAGGDGYLAVWQDLRRCCSPSIYGSRLDAEGTPLDPRGIRLSFGTGAHYDPDVTWTGDEYLAAWQAWDNRIEFTRVGEDGVVRDEIPVAITEDHSVSFEPAVASSAGSTLVVWSGCLAYASPGCDIDIYGAVVDRAGIARGPFPLVTRPGRQDVPHVAAGAGGFLLSWHSDNSGVETMKLDSTGAPTGPPTVIAPGINTEPTAAFDGEHFLVAWRHQATNNSDVQARRLNGLGVPVDPAPIVVADGEVTQYLADVSANSEGFSVVWANGSDDRSIHGTRVTPDGVVQEVGGTNLSPQRGQERAPALATGEGADLLVWFSSVRGSYDVFSKLDPFGSEREVRLVSTAPNSQEWPDSGSNGEGFLAVWTDRRGSKTALYGSRLSATGERLDGAGFKIGDAPIDADPDVASDGRDFLVTWKGTGPSNKGTNLFASRVSRDGAVLDGHPIVVSSAPRDQMDPAVAWTGTDYLVTWEDYRNSDWFYNYDHEVGYLENTDIYGSLVTRDGRVLHPKGKPIARSPVDDESPSVAVGPNGQSLITWGRVCLWDSPSSCTDDIIGRAWSPGLRATTAEFEIAATSAEEERPDVVTTQAGYLVVWDQNYPRQPNTVEGRTVDAKGQMGDTQNIASGGGDHHSPQVDRLGEDFLVAWTQIEEIGYNTYSAPEIYAAVVDENATLTEEPYVVMQGPPGGAVWEVTSRGDSCAAVTYTRNMDRNYGYMQRSFFKLVGICSS